MRLFTVVAFAVLLVATSAQARPGDLDRSFANGGRAAYKLESGGYVSGLTLLDGRRPLLAVGSAFSGKPVPTALTLTAGGRLASRTVFPPPAIRPPRFANGYALTQIGTAPARYQLARIGGAGGVTLTLPSEIDGSPLDLEAGGFGVDGRGRAVVTVTYSRGYGRGWRTVALRYLPSGGPDPSYGRGGLAPVGDIGAYPALVKRDGRLYVLAGLDRRQTQVIALDADGRHLDGFRPRALRSGRFARLGSPQDIIAGPGGRLIIVGTDYSYSGWIAQLDASGRPDRRFGDRGLLRLRRFTPFSVLTDRRGSVVMVGSSTGGPSVMQAAVVRLTARGRRDRSFGTNGLVTKQLGALRGVTLVASEARHVAIDDRGRIVVAGETYDDDYEIRDDLGRSYPAIARLKG